MAIMRITSAGAFKANIAYCLAVVAGGFVSVPCPVARPNLSDDVVVPSKLIPRVNERALCAAWVILANANQMKHVLSKSADFNLCWPILVEAFGNSLSLSRMISSVLADPNIKLKFS